MIRSTILGLMWVAALGAPAVVAGNADFERMLTLEGEWVQVGEDGKPGDQGVAYAR